MMTEPAIKKKRKRSVRKILLWATGIFILLVSLGSVFLYYNFNSLVTEAIIKSFNSSLMSDVYELKFERLSVNLISGNIKVYNVKLQPREKPLQRYPYINSSLRLSTGKILLANVGLYNLVTSHVLHLDRIEISEPQVSLKLDGHINILLPFGDSATNIKTGEAGNKKPIQSFFLKEFELIDASFQVTNAAKEREFQISRLNVSLKDLFINQHQGRNIISNKQIQLSVAEFTGRLKKKAIRFISFKEYRTTIDSFDLQQTPHTVIYKYADFRTGLKQLAIQTADSIFQLTMESFDVSNKEKSIRLTNLDFRPNVSEAALQKRFTYQNTQFSGSVGTVNLTGVNFDALIYDQKLFIDEILLDKISVRIFKDQSKPLNTNRFPAYLGQQVSGIKMPLSVNRLKATNVNLVNTERKPDGSYGKANINRATLDAKNISNLGSTKPLTISANAWVENKAPANLTIAFSYQQPQFSIHGSFKKFNLPDLNPLLNSYAPATIITGVGDNISFSGNVFRTNSSGTMIFLYHDLKVDFDIPDKAKWKSSILSFAANTYLNSSNPASANLPPRVVSFRADRNMNKGFMNILIKSVLNGIKETMIMSKENKKLYRASKKEAKKKRRMNEKNK